MARLKTQRLVFQPDTYQGVQRGIDQIVDAIRPTLGPRPRIVAIDRLLDNKMPELLDNGGTIAKRIIQLPDRDADVGAMFIRDVLWRLQDQVGDGTATAAVLFQAVHNEGVRYLASGGNAMRLQSYLERGVKVILGELTRMTTRLEGKEELAQIAESICYDPPLARLLGEIFDIIGEFGRLEIRPGRSRELEREYVEGMYWERGLVSREMMADPGRQRTDFENAAILISDLEIEEPHQLFPVLELAIGAGIPALLIVAGKVSDRAIGFLLANKNPDKFQAIAVKTPGWGQDEQAAALTDLAVLTGGRPFVKAAGDTFNQIRLEHFGYARRAWADRGNFGVIGGKGDARALRQHIAGLRAAFQRTEDLVLREKLRERIGKLLGGSATLLIGGMTELEIETRKELAERTAATVRLAMMEGVVPGGGVSLLACRPALQQMLDQATDFDERTAYATLIRALEEPFRTIVGNAGYDPSEVMAEIKPANPSTSSGRGSGEASGGHPGYGPSTSSGRGFDVTSGKIVDMMQAGIYDATAVQKSVVFAAISSAALALTIDVMVHHAQPEQAKLPTPSVRKRL